MLAAEEMYDNIDDLAREMINKLPLTPNLPQVWGASLFYPFHFHSLSLTLCLSLSHRRSIQHAA